MQGGTRYLMLGGLVLCAGLVRTYRNLDSGCYPDAIILIAIGAVLIGFGVKKLLGSDRK